jgi:hypothetical protein
MHGQMSIRNIRNKRYSAVQMQDVKFRLILAKVQYLKFLCILRLLKLFYYCMFIVMLALCK